MAAYASFTIKNVPTRKTLSLSGAEDVKTALFHKFEDTKDTKGKKVNPFPYSCGV
jgi:hypothetical protein